MSKIGKKYRFLDLREKEMVECEKKECEPPYGDKADCEFNHNGLSY